MNAEVRVQVDLGERSYDIVIGPGLLDRIGLMLASQGWEADSPGLVVTDRNVAKFGYADRVASSLRAAGFQTSIALVEPGESAKCLEVAKTLYDAAFDASLDRKSMIFAVGGGVVGDLAGFVAATYMRGIAWIQVPTTILAHDSSVGGKVGINHPRGKNMIGAFHQPSAVLFDTSVLRTLPDREVRSGLAEVVKHAAIWDEDFFSWLEVHVPQILALQDSALSGILAKGCQIKAAVVSRDERESGMRAILNFGHTLGHALETLSGYRGITHGEAVAIGMVFAAALSEELGMCAAGVKERLEHLLLAFGLPVRIPKELAEPEILQCMLHDKKAVGGHLTFVLIEKIGRVRIVKNVDAAAVLRVLERLREA
jgi:3-dehydroquinate synthase